MSERILEFKEGKVFLLIKNPDSSLSWPITDILGMECNLSLEKQSSITISLKKDIDPKSAVQNHPSKLSDFHKILFYLITASFLVYLLVAVIANYSIVLALYLGIVFLIIFLPMIIKKFVDCHSDGVFKISVDDPVKFVEFQKALWHHHRGKRLIKTGFVLGETIEAIFYVFLPPVIYNSERFRRYIEFFTKVIYPIFIIILPLFCGICVAISKNFKILYKALKKDALVNLVWTVAEGGIDIIEDIADDYRWSRRLMKKLVQFIDLIEYGFEFTFKWVRMEAVMIFMQIEYFNHCYMSIWKSLLRVLKFMGGFMKKFYLGWLVKAFENGTYKIQKTVRLKDITELHESTEKLQEQISEVKDIIDKKNQ